jgi:hypothetical protein
MEDMPRTSNDDATVAALSKSLGEYAKKAMVAGNMHPMDVGGYMNLTRNHKPRLPDLVSMSKILSAVLAVAPQGLPLTRTLTDAIFGLDHLPRPVYKADAVATWAKETAASIKTALWHCRNMKMKPAVCKTYMKRQGIDAEGKVTLMTLLDKVNLEPACQHEPDSLATKKRKAKTRAACHGDDEDEDEYGDDEDTDTGDDACKITGFVPSRPLHRHMSVSDDSPRKVSPEAKLDKDSPRKVAPAVPAVVAKAKLDKDPVPNTLAEDVADRPAMSKAKSDTDEADRGDVVGSTAKGDMLQDIHPVPKALAEDVADRSARSTAKSDRSDAMMLALHGMSRSNNDELLSQAKAVAHIPAGRTDRGKILATTQATTHARITSSSQWT